MNKTTRLHLGIRAVLVSTLLTMLAIFSLGLSSPVQAQAVDSDGDLNADVTDPFPADPNQGGVYVGGTITCDVLMTGDLDATGFTGTVINIVADGSPLMGMVIE